MKILANTEYAEALKAALLDRQAGTITAQVDTQLGLFLQNVTRWAICDMVKKGKLWRTYSTDTDFQSEILLAVCAKLDKLDLNRKAKEIIVYLKKIAQNRIRNYIRDMSRDKRKHDDVELIECDRATDLYGRILN